MLPCHAHGAVLLHREGKVVWLLGGRNLCPCHRWDERRIRAVFVRGEIIDALSVVREELRSEVGVTHADVAQEEELAGDVGQWPVFLFWRHEIDAKARHDNPSVALLLPVEGEGEEVVVAEIQHREQFVHESVT